jgi:hypothetical protein
LMSDAAGGHLRLLALSWGYEKCELRVPTVAHVPSPRFDPGGRGFADKNMRHAELLERVPTLKERDAAWSLHRGR